MLELFRDLNRALGQTIVMITHNPEAAAVGDRTIEMRDGRVVATAPCLTSSRRRAREGRALAAVARVLLWDLERGSLAYDLFCLRCCCSCSCPPDSWRDPMAARP